VKYHAHRAGHFTSLFYLPRNEGPLKGRPVHSRLNLGASEEGKVSLIICSKEGHRFDELYCFGRDRGSKVIKKTI
jgi:hypothetical protein